MTIISRSRRGQKTRPAVTEMPTPCPEPEAVWNFADVVDLARGLGYSLPSPAPEHEAGW